MGSIKRYTDVYNYLKINKDGVTDITGEAYAHPYLTGLLSLPWEYKLKILNDVRDRVKILSKESKELKHQLNLLGDQKIRPYLIIKPGITQYKLSEVKAKLRYFYLVIKSIKTNKVEIPNTKCGKTYRVTLLCSLYYGVIQRTNQPHQYRINCLPLEKVNTKINNLDLFLGINNEQANKYASKLNGKIRDYYDNVYKNNSRYNEIKDELSKLANERDNIVNTVLANSLIFINTLK